MPDAPPAASDSASGPTQFADALDAFEEMADYTPDDGTLAIESTNPLVIRISPEVMQADAPDLTREMVLRAAVYGALRVFLHTDADAVRITSVPLLVRNLTDRSQNVLLDSPRATLSVTRAQVQEVVKTQLGLSGLSGLVGGLSPDSWSDTARRAMYSDEGPPGLESFAQALGVAL